MIRAGSRSFHTASLLLPDSIRDAAYALYGFCRLSDDAIDVEGGDPQAAPRLRARLERVYAGEPAPEPVDRALADAVAGFAIPRALMEALLEGFEWDVEGRVYETLPELRAYAARVAGSVGAMMAALMGARSPDLVARACDLGVAMQLTNIARDVGEDARLGRLYLPREWLREVGIDDVRWLSAPVFSPSMGHVINRVLAEASTLYARADLGIANLDPAYRPAIFCARRLYAAIGERLASRGLDSVNARTTVPAWRKAILVAQAVRQAARAPRADPAGPPLEETRFLVEAIMAEPPRPHPAQARRRGPGADLAWTIELFTSLEGRGARLRRQAAVS